MTRDKTTLALLALVALGGGALLLSRRSAPSVDKPPGVPILLGSAPPAPMPPGLNVLSEGDIPSHDYKGIPLALGVNLEPEELE